MDTVPKTWGLYALICIIWGTSWGFVKIGLEHFPPFTFAGLRFIIALLCVFPLLKKKHFLPINEPQFWYCVTIVSFFAYTLPISLLYFGQRIVPSALASVLFSTFPLWVTIATYLFLPNEKIDSFQVIGVFTCFIGVVALFNPKRIVYSNEHLLGMLAILTSAVLQTIPLIVARKSCSTYNSFGYNTLSMGIAAIVLLSIGFSLNELRFVTFSMAGLIALLYLGIFGTAISFVGYFWLITYLPPLVLSLTAFITPLIAIVVGIFLLDEYWSLELTIGTIAILLGIFLTLFGKRYSVELHKQIRKFLMRYGF
ncbi:MAG: DMT family transporter [Bacteroidetes bacterium]|nr:DMT family transporter [Bacteroidota bacterium]